MDSEEPSKGKILAEISLGSATDIVVKDVMFKGKRYIDIRKYVATAKYSGPTQKGIMVPIEHLAELIQILTKVT